MQIRESGERGRRVVSRGYVAFLLSGLGVGVVAVAVGMMAVGGVGSGLWSIAGVVAGTVLPLVAQYRQWSGPERQLHWWVALSGVGMVLLGLSAAPTEILGYVLFASQAFVLGARTTTRAGRRWVSVMAIGGSATLIGRIAWAQMVNGVGVGEEGWSPLSTRFLDIAVVLSIVCTGTAVVFYIFGRESQRRQERLAALAQQARYAAVEERTRIAREMHDIIAHSLTVIISQSDGGRFAGRTDPEKALAALDTISAHGREALSQLWALLDVLREGDSGDAGDAEAGAGEAGSAAGAAGVGAEVRAGQRGMEAGAASARSTGVNPQVRDIPALLEDACGAGNRVSYTERGLVEGERPELAEHWQLNVYRIVQEALTNARKHAPGSTIRVEMEWGARALELQVENSTGAVHPRHGGMQVDGTGRGLSGIRERARLCGGEVEWGASDAYPGGWALRARIPYTREP